MPLLFGCVVVMLYRVFKTQLKKWLIMIKEAYKKIQKRFMNLNDDDKSTVTDLLKPKMKFLSKDCTIGMISENNLMNLFMVNKQTITDDFEQAAFDSSLSHTNKIKTSVNIKELKQIIDFYSKLDIRIVDIILNENDVINEQYPKLRPMIIVGDKIAIILAPIERGDEND